jgi:hypothetical protein
VRQVPEVGQHEAGGELEQRGLAGAIAAEQTDDVVGRDGEIDAVERDLTGIGAW